MQGNVLVATPAPNSVTTATSGWLLRVSERPAVIQHSRVRSYGQCSVPAAQGSVPEPRRLHAPPRAILRAQVLRRDLAVRDLAGVRIDVEHLGRAHRQIAQ